MLIVHGYTDWQINYFLSTMPVLYVYRHHTLTHILYPRVAIIFSFFKLMSAKSILMWQSCVYDYLIGYKGQEQTLVHKHIYADTFVENGLTEFFFKKRRGMHPPFDNTKATIKDNSKLLNGIWHYFPEKNHLCTRKICVPILDLVKSSSSLNWSHQSCVSVETAVDDQMPTVIF